ncbi:hypothetical protein [Pseudooceanicola algae]|uniref:Uncharacterized protein n=1 Tax=Pseudooceanicola algae TaxID=1537215 RepID=A0A418SDP1_9RHOB|nr:hypothetical protein [Pseudooceanicola algae]QPM92572.1 hypothetical protein PSAL_038360 [Pseudooceanicola algae]
MVVIYSQSASSTAPKAYPSYRYVDGRMAILFSERENLFNSTYPAFGEGSVWQAGPYLYTEVSFFSTNYHLVTPGGVRLRVAPDEQGRYPIGAFPGSFPEALELAVSAGAVQLEAAVTYTAERSAVFRDMPVRIYGNGSKIQRLADADNDPILDIGFSFSDPVPVSGISLISLWAGYPVATLSGSANFQVGQTVSMVGRQYRFVTNLSAPNDVLIGSSRTQSLVNLKDAINGSSGAGSRYASSTVTNAELSATMNGSNLEVTSTAQIIPDNKWQFGTNSGNWQRQNSPTVGGRVTLFSTDFSTLDVQVGDVMKVVSDDYIPWSDPDDNEYCGESIRVDGISEGKYILTSQPPAMWQHFQTNTRLARLTDMPVRIENLECSDTEGFDPEINTSHILITGAVQPELRNVGTHFGAASHLELFSCYKPKTQGIYGTNLRTSTAERYNAFGYVMVEYGCTGGKHTDLFGSKCRHVYTTGARGISTPPSSEMARYGGVIGAVIQGIGADCEHYAFDTHSDALRCHFDVTVSQGYSGMLASLFGVQLRGEGHTLRADVEAQACVTVKVVGDGRGEHDIDVIYRRPDLQQGMQTDLVRFDSDSSQPSRIRMAMRATISDYGNPIIHSSGVDVLVSRLDIEYAPQTDYTGAIFYQENCRIECSHLDWDMQHSTAATPRIVRQKGPAGDVVIDHARIRNAPTFYVGDLGSESSARIIIHDLLTDSPVQVLNQSSGWDVFANRIPGAIGLANVRTHGSGHPLPSIMAYASAAGGAKNVIWRGRFETNLLLLMANTHSTDVDLSSLTAPAHEGQRLTISIRSPSFGYTLRTTTANVSLANDLLMGPGQVANFIGYQGVWIRA